jgi:ubiquinone/menaquinone biosynthesis C-methylase UbiE
MVDKKQKYDLYLQEFMDLCNKLVDVGLPYVAVIMNHELYRFLYPSEPVCGFINDNPVEFITDHIRKLIDMGNCSLNTISPYKMDFSNLDAESEGKSLEEKTSDLYSALWSEFKKETLTEESKQLLSGRLGEDVVEKYIKDKVIFDMGCGSGRYSIALALLGAQKVIGGDIDESSFKASREFCDENGIPVSFEETNFLNLPFEEDTFDFVLCNGTIHHSASIFGGLSEIKRVLKKDGKAFIYIYAAKGIFWETRAAMRKFFKRIPLVYARQVLKNIGMPPNRFIFCDVWYVPVETHTAKDEIEGMFAKLDFSFSKIISKNTFDLDKAISEGVKDAEIMWGDGEHRYIVWK